MSRLSVISDVLSRKISPWGLAYRSYYREGRINERRTIKIFPRKVQCILAGTEKNRRYIERDVISKDVLTRLYCALGGGAEIASSCDFRLITEDCRGMGFVHSRMGIIPAWGASTRLVKLLGAKRALDVVLTARIFPPSEALQMGLVDEIIENAEFAEGWLRERTRGSADVVQAAKLVITGCQERLDFEGRALEFERRVFSPLWGGRANREALNSQLKHL